MLLSSAHVRSLDRLGQIGPSVLVAVDGYRYGTRAVDRLSELEAIRKEIARADRDSCPSLPGRQSASAGR